MWSVENGIIMLRIENITKRYGNLLAVNNLSMEINSGDMVGLLGPNGAGKSTLISLISTILKPDSGNIYYNAESVYKDENFKKKIGVVPQEIALYSNLSGVDNLRFFGAAYGLKNSDLDKKINEVIEITKMQAKINEKVKNYSGGMKGRLNIAVALLNSPEILIMDEATVGIDPQSRNFILESVKKFNEAGMTVIYSTHYMQELVRLDARLYILDSGRIVQSGTLLEILERLGLPIDMDLEDVFLYVTGKELRDI